MFAKIKSVNYLLLLIVVLFSCGNTNHIKELRLANWEFREQNKEWLPANVPGFVHLDLYSNNLIEDPFYRNNESESEWVAEKIWEYKSTFHLDSEFLNQQSIKLNFSGVDTYADVFLNDRLIKSCDNYFVAYSIETKHLLKESNELRFVFKPTHKVINQLSENAPYSLPGEERVYTRKPQFHFGWDWGPKLIGCGITEAVTLTASNTAQISNFHISTLIVSDTIAKMRLEIEVFNSEQDLHTIEFLGKNYPVNNGSTVIEFSVENPDLWFPRSYGEQKFKHVDFALLNKNKSVVDERHDEYAIRTIDLIQEEDSLGKGFKFNVNGKDVYAKGANWIPLDFFHTRVDSNQYRKALNEVVESNMNMLRVWGGGIYENNYFYDLCDSLGILVWQDFMFACAMYPGDSVFMNSVEIEAIQQIKRLRKHPSIALWCGNNENSEGWQRWGWQTDRSEAEIVAIWSDYQNLFNKLLPNLVDSLTETAYWESSPQHGRGNPQHQFTGDAHYWGVWHDAEPFENFESKVPRFMSEYGFQSFPSITSIDLYALEEDFDLDSDVMKTHQKHPRGNSLIQEYMLRDFKAPADFESFVYLSQVLQADGMLVGMEAHRRARPYNMGTLYWQFNDCWPAASWSSRDYYGNWKALQYTVKRAYQDLLISTVQTEEEISIYVVNDAAISQEYELLIEHVNYQGNTLKSNAFTASVNASSSSFQQSLVLNDYLYIDSTENRSYLDIQLLLNGEIKARTLHHFVKTKEMDLPYTGISHKVEKDSLGFVLELFSDAFMKNVMITSLHDGRFDDNFFDLPANEHRRIRFYNDYPMDEFNPNNLSFFSVVDTY